MKNEDTTNQDRVWASLERKVSLGVDSYESFTIHVGQSVSVDENESNSERLVAIQAELVDNLMGMIDLLKEQFGVED